MKVWLQIILEWINCLDVSNTNVKNLKELEDQKVYKKLLELISWKDDKEISDTENIITGFLQDEYPKFKLDNENLGEMEQMYIASLFLLYVSYKPLFQRPMCTRLQHEAQLKIKTFLEKTIPYGKDINRETIREIILQLEDNTPKTPNTPRTQTLGNFFESPAVRSAQTHKILIEKNRELRKLSNELEMERFEKADLQEDLGIYQNRVQSLQQKLQEKNAEIKALREEKMQPSTPQSCKKNHTTTNYKNYYRKEVDRLEDQLMQKQHEIDNLEMNNNALLQKITYVEKQSIYFKEKLKNYEKASENLQLQGEIKDTELVNLRIANEELRTHLREINQISVEEKSFEIDGVAPLNLHLSPLNSSDALSRVIDIQLQEAKEESASLKSQLDVLNEKLESTRRDCKKGTELLKTHALAFQDMQTKLNNAVNKSINEIESLQKKNTFLINENENLKDLCSSQKESVSKIEESKNVLSIEVDTLKGRIKDLEKFLHNESVNSTKLHTALTEAKLQIDDNLKCIQDLTHQNELYKTSIERCNTNLRNIILRTSEIKFIENNNVDGAETMQLIEYVETVLHNCDKKYTSKEIELQLLNNAMEEAKLKLQHFQSQTSELENKEKHNIIEITKLKEIISQNVTQTNEFLITTNQYSEEIKNLKEIQIEKEALEKDLSMHKKEVNEKNLLLKSLITCIYILKENFHTLQTEFHVTKKDVVNHINEYKKQCEGNIKNILGTCQNLCRNFTKEQICRKNLENKLADSERELNDSKNINTTLENNLMQTKQTVNNLETELISYKRQLEDIVQKFEKLQDINVALEKERKHLIFENEKILSDVNNVKDKLKLSEDGVCNLSGQLKCKDEKIKKLITSLKFENEYSSQLQMEGESKMNNLIKELETKLLEKQHNLNQLSVETKLKQETLELVQNKFEKASKEAIASEMKMKEVIMNLQEVRSNQDAVLTAQEEALKEKYLQLEQLQKEYSNTKSALCKQLEDEKSLCKNLQSTNSELEIQSYKQIKTIEELQEVLRSERSELNKNKEQYKIENIKTLEIAQICKELEQSANYLKLTMVKASPDLKDLYTDVYDVSCADNDDKTNNILNIVRYSINEIHASCKLILHMCKTNVNLNETLQQQKVIVDNSVRKCEVIELLKNKVQEFKNSEEKNLKHLNNLIKHKESLRDSIQSVMKSRKDLDVSLNELRLKWDRLLIKFYTIYTSDVSICDELKQLQARKTHFEYILSEHNACHLANMKSIYAILWEKFLWTEETLKKNYFLSTTNEQFSDTSDIFSDEKTIIEAGLHNNTMLQKKIIQSQNEIEDFFRLIASFDISCNSDKTKSQSEVEKKLQLQVNELMEEKADLKNKLDCACMVNTKLDDHIDELKSKLQGQQLYLSKELEKFDKQLLHAKEENLKLQKEKDELSKRPKTEDVNNQLKYIHRVYELEFQEMKKTMNATFELEMKKLNMLSRKQGEELNKYKAHVADMSSQIWNIGEKLLCEQQNKETVQKELINLKAKYQNLDPQIISSIEHKSSKYERRDLVPRENKEEILHKVGIITEKTTYDRRCSIRSIQTMGNAFNAEDEEGHLFDNVHLADIKNGHSTLHTATDRLNILKKRNDLCKPHLKSSYPAEMQFHPLPFTEEEIKTGSTADEIFNDSLSQSLLPEQKARKKDRTQTSYKKPGPPTPSKNGGRLSLQSNDLRSPNSRILRERNKERTTTTPRTLKALFGSKRHDGTIIVTPKRRRSSIFRKYRGTNDR